MACIASSAPQDYAFQYQIGVVGCATDCTAPGQTPISAAARGDTVWLRHGIVLLQSSGGIKRVTLRPNCAENVLIQSGTTAVDTVPTPSCPDSTTLSDFALGTTLTRYNQWIVDSTLAPAAYSVVGRIMVQPRIEPRFIITIQ